MVDPASDAESDLHRPPVIPLYSTSPGGTAIPLYSTTSSLGVPEIETSRSRAASKDGPLSASPPSSKLLHHSHNPSKASLYNNRIILTTYPGQVGVNPIPLTWGALNPDVRGPVIASRSPESMKVRNSIGAHGGSYCIYRALAVAIGDLEPGHKPDLRDTQPVISIGPYPSWGEPDTIVSMDPWGHRVIECFDSQIVKQLDVRPTIAVTKAHMRVPEIEYAVSVYLSPSFFLLLFIQRVPERIVFF